MAGGDVFAPARWKHLDLRPARIRVTTEPTGDSLRVTLAAEAVALFVTLEADRPGRFSTNAISLFPGHDAAITFTPTAGDPADTTLTVRDLHSSFATA
jgi:beta-mannosidase